MDLSLLLFPFVLLILLLVTKKKTLLGENSACAVWAVARKQTRDRQSLKRPWLILAMAVWWSSHGSQSCNDLTVFAVGSMCAEKKNPKAGRSLQSLSLGLNVVQKPETASLEMQRICCSSWARACQRFMCALKDGSLLRKSTSMRPRCRLFICLFGNGKR